MKKPISISLKICCILFLGLSSCATPQQQLLNASLACHPETIDAMLSKGVDIEVRDKFGHTPLMLSLVGGDTACVKHLLENGADINAKSNYEFTPHLVASQTPYYFKTSEILDAHQGLQVRTFGLTTKEFQERWLSNTSAAKHDWEEPSVADEQPFYKYDVNFFERLMMGEYHGEAYWASVSLMNLLEPLTMAMYMGEVRHLIENTNPSLSESEIEKILRDLKLLSENLDQSKRVDIVVFKEIVYSIEVGIREGAFFHFSVYPLQKVADSSGL